MPTYSLYPSNPVLPLVSDTGPFGSGVIFQPIADQQGFYGYRWYVPAGGDTAAQTFCLYSLSGNVAGTLIPAATVTSGVLTAGAWNIIMLATPVQLAKNMQYEAQTCWTMVHGFPALNNQFGSGDPFAAGITNGPLQAFSDTSGSLVCPWGTPQGLFSTASANPAAGPVGNASNSANFGIDVITGPISNAALVGQSVTPWPNPNAANPQTVNDSDEPYTSGNLFSILPAFQYFTPTSIEYFTPATAAGLASKASIWSTQTGLVIATNAAPSWSGAAGSAEFVSCALTGAPNLTAAGGPYVVSVFAANGSYLPKDASTDFWGAASSTGAGANGFTWGPLYFPPQPSALLGYNYNAGDPGSTPPFTDGTRNKAQSVFGQNPGGTEQFPQLVALVSTPVAGSSQNYWVKVTGIAGPLVPSAGGLLTPGYLAAVCV
jgi:hypothetical protein